MVDEARGAEPDPRDRVAIEDLYEIGARGDTTEVRFAGEEAELPVTARSVLDPAVWRPVPGTLPGDPPRRVQMVITNTSPNGTVVRGIIPITVLGDSADHPWTWYASIPGHDER